LCSSYAHGLSKQVRLHGIALANGQSKLHYASFVSALFNAAEDMAIKFAIPFTGEIEIPKTDGE